MVAEIDKRTDNLVSSWLPLPDVADRLGTDVNRVRQLVRERQLIAVRRSERDALEVPEAFIEEGKVIKGPQAR
jgi:hypothetical protein